MTDWRGQFEELSRVRYRSLVAYARLLTGEPESAQDLVHDALIRVFGKSRNFPSAGHAEAYVKRAIASAFVDTKRRETIGLRLRSTWAVREVTPDDGMTLGTRDEVQVALMTLSPRERACTILRYYDDLAITEVADALGISVGATKRYLGDGREKLAARLGGLQVDPPAPTAHVTSERSPR